MSSIDQLLGTFDRALRTLTGTGESQRDAPDVDAVALSDEERRHAAGLMRVNHTGEVCAQALYEGQALTARRSEVKSVLESASREEADHLLWCRRRLDELGSRPSVLDPAFFAASCALGMLTGLLGDRISLGFVEATEDQVVRHLDRHLDRLPERDARSRAILTQMRADEMRHGTNAVKAGGMTFPRGVKRAMALVSKVMTETTYRI